MELRDKLATKALYGFAGVWMMAVFLFFLVPLLVGIFQAATGVFDFFNRLGEEFGPHNVGHAAIAIVLCLPAVGLIKLAEWLERRSQRGSL